MKKEYTREELIKICEKSFVPQSKWWNRDSAEAQKQLGQCYAWLKDGCKFDIEYTKDGKGCNTDDETIWVEVFAEGFESFEYGGGHEDAKTFYLPTEKRLKRARGGDWY